MTTSRRIYEKLTDDEDARACADIPADACRESPQNFVLLLISQFLTRLGDAVANPKTLLAWVTSSVGAPPVVLGFLVPIRESGSMILQIFIGSYVRRLPVRKWVWVAGSVVQALAVAGLGVVAATLRGATAGWAIIALLIVFALARGFCSVASKDVLGKTIPKRRRGRLNGWSASAAGLVTVGVGATLLLPVWQRSSDNVFAILLVAAGSLWIAAALTYSAIREYPGETDGGRNALRLALSRLVILRDDPPFRNFVIARALLMCSALSAPYYVALAQTRLGSPAYLLGLFIVADGLANLVSAPVWGRQADRSSRKVMIAAASLTATIGLVVFLGDVALPAAVESVLFLPLAYFVLSISHAGVRVGRKTYVVDLASGNRRTDYVAVSNTVIGVLLLVAGSVGVLTEFISESGVIAVLSLMGLAGVAMSATLPEVERPG